MKLLLLTGFFLCDARVSSFHSPSASVFSGHGQLTHIDIAYLLPSCADCACYNRFLKRNLLQLRPELIIAHQLGHRTRVLLVVQEHQYYEFVSIYEILISEHQQTNLRLSGCGKNFCAAYDSWLSTVFGHTFHACLLLLGF